MFTSKPWIVYRLALGAGRSEVMTLRVAVQMDPIDKINIGGDSTFAILLEAQARGHEIFYYRPEQLSLSAGEVVAPVQPLEVRDVKGDHFTLGAAMRTDLREIDVILLRQDPPFDLAYITSTHLLEMIHPHTLVVNDPASVRNAPEKLFVLNYPQLMPPTLISRDKNEIDSFRREFGEVVMKPLHGHGGSAVFKISLKDPNFGSLFDMFSTTFREPWVIQKFLPKITLGDKRIILVDGVAKGAVNRVPAENDIRSNMVRGGSPKDTQLSEREQEICQTIGPDLKARGLLFVGIDVIDGNLTEINVTSPTGLRAIANLGGGNLAQDIWDAIEARL
jgi:glutathione synthase